MFLQVLKSVKSVRWFLAMACVAWIPFALNAQDTVKPAAKASTGYNPSKWEIFVGYSYLAPHGNVVETTESVPATLIPGGNGRAQARPFASTTTSSENVSYDNVSLGQIFSVSYFFNRYVGIQGEAGIHEWGIQNSNPPGETGTRSNNDGFTTVAGGLVLRYPAIHFSPFAHADFGGAMVDGPLHNPYTWGPSATAGGGLDYVTPWLLRHHLAIRLVQADYEYMHINFGAENLYASQTVNINAARLSAGIVFHGGSVAQPAPLTLACAVNPATIYAGDPVTVTATPGALSNKKNNSVVYTWSGPGVTGNGTTATVATGSLAPGVYTVKAVVKEGKAGKEGLKPWETAESSASFTVKQFEPPTVSCSASPSTIKPGESSTVTCSGVSPQNRPLTYNYSATAGTVTGNGATASFSSTGAPTGAVAITCNVSDDKGQTATASANVTITAPYVAPTPHTEAQCSINFATDKKRPMRVDNEAKACLDQMALELQKQSDAKAVVVGEENAAERAKTAKEEKAAKKNKHMKMVDPAAERAVNTKDYLVKEKGIDASRISVATGTVDEQKVENYVVPAGANFTADVQGTTPVNEAAVKAQPRKPLAAARKKTAAKKKPAARQEK